NDTVPLYEQKITAHNRQEMYAYMAQANGGITGVLPGNSRETARLPLAFSDYIYSIVVEDLGLVGGLFLLIIYMSLLGRAGVIAGKCDRAFASLIVMGMAVMIVFQAMFHMAINTGVFPVSGQPLPMISKGGTSMLVTSLAFGIMLSISRYASTAGRKKAPKTDTDLPDELNALNPTQLKK
ncbi:MAG: FtsW/RodA/SpoVE family cell cycle protein, partial [Muribaculaceae bacterium]|nr:FtsW/RodA/SpoVE family cell cycle protein [Muribaculaceae bacterium]